MKKILVGVIVMLVMVSGVGAQEECGGDWRMIVDNANNQHYVCYRNTALYYSIFSNDENRYVVFDEFVLEDNFSTFGIELDSWGVPKITFVDSMGKSGYALYQGPGNNWAINRELYIQPVVDATSASPSVIDATSASPCLGLPLILLLVLGAIVIL